MRFWIGLNSPNPGEGSAREPGPDRREPAGAQIAAKPMGKRCICKTTTKTYDFYVFFDLEC